MTKAIVLGNGESRKNVNYRRDYSDYFVIGCNGAYKEDVDALVCNDAYMQYIIYDTGYCKDHLCFFSEWTPIPIDVVDSVVESMGLPVIHNKNKIKNCDMAQVAGSQDYIYITYLEKNDMVTPIPEIKVSSGSRALMLACDMGFDEILMLGFDGMGAKNIYQKDKGYERSTPREEWVEERQKIKEKYRHIKIIES